MRRALLPALCFVLLFLAPSTALSQTTATSGQQRGVTASFFGVSVDGLNVAPSWPLNIPVGTLGKTEGTEWNWIEPSNGTFDWTALDDSIAFARGAGVSSFVYTFWSTPQWASSEPSQSCILTAEEGVRGCAAPPSSIGDWDRFVKALVNRYAGQIKYFEIWNEANLAETWSGNVSQMVTMAEHAYADIKALDPGAVVLAPSVSRVGVQPYSTGCNPAECWLAEYLQAGGGRYADGFSFHPYACFENDTACAQLGIGCAQGQIQACAGSPLETEIGDTRSIMAQFGYSGKPIMSTEGGFPSDIIGQDLLGTSEQQTAYVSRWYIIQASENVTAAVWFSEFRPQNGMLGFGTSPALGEINQAYNQTYKWLVGSTMDAPCSLSGAAWECAVTLSSGTPAQIVFADVGNTTVPSSFLSNYAEYQCLNGSEFPLNGPLNVGIEPILLLRSGSTGTSSSSATLATTTTSAASSVASVTSNGSSSEDVIYAAAVGVAAVAIAGIILVRRSRRGP
ncbi:MAG TPA: hypothetical protein VEH01_03210 [Nitrososphaerales archaeon]|nr:hypothetical protein [Nitrososphaerales archaeon]